MNLKKGFTLVELMAVLAICGVIGLITMSGYNGASNYLKNIKLKNITIEFKNALNSIITSEIYYPGNSDLADTREIKIRDASDNEKTYKGNSKFRGLFLREIHALDTNSEDCYMISDDKSATVGRCNIGTNNIRWAIPDTDFDSVNAIFTPDASGSIYKYTPITIYPAKAEYSTLDDFEKNAIIIGVRRDGDITIINTVDCTISKYQNCNQCKIKEILSSAK